MVVPCTIHIINHWSFKLLHTVAVYLLNYTLIMMWRYAGTKYIATYLKTKLKLRMYFLKITSIFISISLNSTYYPEFNLEASWGGCKPILLLNYCTSRETLLACSTVANHIMSYISMSLMMINSRYTISFNSHAVSHSIPKNTAVIWLKKLWKYL